MKTEIVKQIRLDGEIKTRFYSRPYSDTQGNEEEGILIYNEKGEHVCICFDTVQNCCEAFRYEIPKEMFKHKYLSEFGVNIIALKLTPEKSDESEHPLGY